MTTETLCSCGSGVPEALCGTLAGREWLDANKPCGWRFLWPDHGHYHLYVCEKKVGHDGQHQHGNFVWEPE